MTPEQAFISSLTPVECISGKVFPVEALKDATAPFVFYLQQSDDEDDTLDGPSGLMSAVYEIHCVTQTYAALIVLVSQVRSALRSMQGCVFEDLLIERVSVRQASPELREKEVNLYRKMLRLELHFQKEVISNE